MSLNASAYHLLGRPEAIELLYDRGKRVIGFRPVAADAPHAYPIRGVGGKKDSGTFIVSGRAFLGYFAIPFGEPVRRDAVLQGDTLIIDLNDAGRDASSNRNRKKSQDRSLNGSRGAHDDDPDQESG